MKNKIRNFIRRVKERLLYVQPSGPYKFLVKKIHNSMDIDLASTILSTDYYKANLEPLPIDLKALNKVVVFAPHQDDEAIGCGGLLSELSEKGVEISLVFLTDGRPVSKDWKKEVVIRSIEAKRVANKLNAKIYEIGIDNVKFDVQQSQLKRIEEILKEPFDAMFTVWALDAPPKHRFCNAILAYVSNRILSNDFPVYSYQVHTPLLPNVYFDYTHLFEKKQELINEHQSQMVVQNYSHIGAGLDAWSSRYLPWSNKPRFVECYTLLPHQEWQKWTKFYQKNPNQAFKGNQYLIDSFKSLMKK